MAETPRSVQAAPLEIPVTIQGSRTVEGSDQRELFVESTKTTLVFDSGAVLSLKAKVAPGQCVFLRNEETGKEILCKVLESRQQGDSNYADLEFTVYEPDFWNGHAEGEEAGGQKSDAQKKIEAAVASLAANSKDESSPPVSDEIPAPIPEKEVASRDEQTEAPSPAAGASAEETAEPKEQPAVEKAEVHAEANQEATNGESHDAEAELAAMDPVDAISDETEAEDGTEPAPKKKKRQKPPRPPNFKARKIAAAVSVTLAIAVISFQVYSWRGRIFHLKKSSHSSTKISNQPAVSTMAHAAPPAAAATASAPTGSSGKHAPAANAAPAVTVAAVKAPSISAKPLASPVTPSDSLKAERIHEPAAAKASKHAKIIGPAEPEIVPAQIVSQPQPSMPPWAKKLDLDGVVKLDAVIDEKGNITETTPISGSPILQHSAEEAVALWIFQPATQDGKPVASHMVLTVEFQR
jgi:hypothetical protein